MTDIASKLPVALHDQNGAAFGPSNPLAVYTTENPGDEINDFDEASIAKNASADHDYTVTALKILAGIKVSGSASGRARFELQVETAPTVFETVMVKFNSTANPNVEMEYLKEVAAGLKVRITKTHIDNSNVSMLIYTQIRGIEN